MKINKIWIRQNEEKGMGKGFTGLGAEAGGWREEAILAHEE